MGDVAAGSSQALGAEPDVERVAAMIAALAAAKARAADDLVRLRARMGSTRAATLWAQAATVVFAFGALIGLVFAKHDFSVIAAALAMICSIGAVIAEHGDRMADKAGEVQDAHARAEDLVFQATVLSAELVLLLKHRHGVEAQVIEAKLAEAAALCEAGTNSA